MKKTNMKIEIHTQNPHRLLEKIKKDIANESIKTWSIVKSAKGGEFLTHTPDQWFKKALLGWSFGSNPGRLILTVTNFTNSIPDEYTKGLYIGRFTEELLEHYRPDFSKLEIF